MRLRVVSREADDVSVCFSILSLFTPFPLWNISPVETARSNKKDPASEIYGRREKKSILLPEIPSSLVAGSHPFPRASVKVKQGVAMPPRGI